MKQLFLTFLWSLFGCIFFKKKQASFIIPIRVEVLQEPDHDEDEEKERQDPHVFVT